MKPIKPIKKIKPLTPEVVKEKDAPLYNDLRQVIDYSRDFSMFYSGVEYEVYLDGCYDMGVRNFLMSYEYLRGKGSTQLKKHPDMHLFIDSGAYTYQVDSKYAEYTEEQWVAQIEEYLAWAEKHKESIFAMAELDLQNLLGEEVIQEWRRKYFEPFMLRTGIPICFIYHHEGMKTWEKMCERYPFVGFSSVADDGATYDLDGFREMLRIAEKYDSVVHGFGMTRTSVLPELPFYTVDSTSWKSGFRYGQLAIWNGKKVQMFKKEDWDAKVLPVIRGYNDITLNEDLLREYYEPEILRANVYAYQKAEEYIIERQKPLTYWKKAKAVKVDINNLPDDFFPPHEWFLNDTHEGVEEYARKMNLNPEYNVIDMLYDVTAFMNWDEPEYEDMVNWYFEPAQEGLIDKLHDEYINRIAPDMQAKIADLRRFFSSCVSGENDKLLQIGTNFDRIVKEREDYIEEDDTELVDLPEEEVKLRLSHLLPTPSDKESEGAPEIDSLDEEIYRKADIVPTFSDDGKFLKGQVAVRKPKKVYSKKYPKFACDTCYAAAKCPEFKQGYVCAYQKMFERFDTRDMTDIIQSIQGMVEHNMTRMQRAMVMETINGSIDPQVTSFIDQNMRLMTMLKQMYENGSAEVLRQTNVVRADGSCETTTQITNPQSGGILEKLFGNMTSDPSKKEAVEVIDVEAEEVTEHKKNSRYENMEDV